MSKYIDAMMEVFMDGKTDDYSRRDYEAMSVMHDNLTADGITDNKIHDAVNDYACRNEQWGFEAGFKEGVKFMLEVLG